MKTLWKTSGDTIYSERLCKAHDLIDSIFALLMLLAATQPTCAALALEQVRDKPYFDASDVKAVRKGGFGVAKIQEVSDREIAVVIACLVKGAREELQVPFSRRFAIGYAFCRGCLGPGVAERQTALRDRGLVWPVAGLGEVS